MLSSIALLGTPARSEQAIYATFETSAGKIVVKLLPAKAPETVKNFVELAEGKKKWKNPQKGGAEVKAPLFDGTLFHRVIPQFMIQGGDPLTKDAPAGARSTPEGRPFGTGGPGYEFKDELVKDDRPFEKPCQLAMANHGPNTNGSQFFITEGSGASVGQLNPVSCDAGICGYTHFGEGLCGCELVGQIARAGNSNTRLVKVVITRGSKPPVCN